MKSAQKPGVDAGAAIERLVNHNPAPKLVGDVGQAIPIFDAKYDWTEYHRVWKALRELAANAEALWPELVNHLNDDRYCMTVLTFSDNTHNWTVGDVCHELISVTLAEAYYRDLQPESLALHGSLSRPKIGRDKKVLKSWCIARSGKKLYELQIEMCKWAIKELTESKNLKGVSDSRRRAWVASIDAMVRSLTESKHAVLPRWFKGEEYSPYSAETAEDIRKQYSESKNDK